MSASTTEPAWPAAGRVLELHLHLLDRQVVDRDGRMVAKVDDLELTASADGDLYVTGIYCGAQAWGRRLGGRLGWWVESAARRLHPRADAGPQRIDISLVSDIGSAVTLGAARSDVHAAPLEEWVGEHVIGRIPGTSHESD